MAMMLVDDGVAGAGDRARKRAAAVLRFYRERYDQGERRAMAMVDLVADLIVYAEHAGYGWDQIVAMAGVHANAELRGEL